MEEINPSRANPARGTLEGREAYEVEIIEFTEHTIVLRSMGSGRTWGISLNNAGKNNEEIGVAEHQPITGEPKPELTGPIAHHWV